MFKWSARYAIGVDTVDHEHEQLFLMLEKIADDIASGNENYKELGAALDALLDYANKHFADEEEIMLQNKVDPRHLKMQQMAHKSFFYDLDKIRNRPSDYGIAQHFDRLVSFVTSWLVFHTLRTDQELGVQLREIKAGRTPEEAYAIAENTNFNANVYRPVVDALVHLWTESAERVTYLEDVLENNGISV
jgi:hemerythrin